MKRPPQDLQIPFDRVTYREGQLLASRDLQDDVRTDQRLRSLHTHYLHDTWGIALGFTVTASAGSASVGIGPGYALDDSDQEILLDVDLLLPVPNTQAITDLVLVIRHQPDSAYRALPGTASVCFGGGIDPRDERPVFVWRTLETLQTGPDVPLVKITAQLGALLGPPDLSVRRNATRFVRPHIGSGVADIGDSSGQTVFVDTSDAGFTQTPLYFARFEGSSPKLPPLLIAEVNALASIVDPTPAGFSLAVPLQFLVFERFTGISVVWLGIEQVTGCEPVANILFPFLLSGFALASVAATVQEVPK